MSELSGYDYELPDGLIAQYPLARRADARLLIVDRGSGSLSHRHMRDLPEVLNPTDCLVVNNTRVVPARLIGRRSETGGKWEGLFLSDEGPRGWRLLAKSRGKPAPGEAVMLLDLHGQDAFRLHLQEKLPGGVWLAKPDSDEPCGALLERVGRVPLPRYIRDGEMDASDRERYQTVFASEPGAVAAPTAGLHFTRPMLEELARRGVRTAQVTLHVGLDTFRPITTTALADHAMHSEFGSISAQSVEMLLDARRRGGRTVAVGTTSARVLETAAADGALKPWSGKTNLFIRPPYEFRAVDALLTNFHLPRTTLLVMVRCFGGDDLVMRAYHEAIRERYRFYSYGDAMLIL